MQTATITRRPTHTSGRGVARIPHRTPLPATEPPYDDQPAPRGRYGNGSPLTQGTLALDLRSDPATDRTSGAPHLSLVRALDTDQDTEDQFFAPQRTSRDALPNPRPWCGRFVQALVEVLSGDRPAAQLMRWTTDPIFTEVARRARAVATSRTPAQPGRALPGNGRVMVRSVRVCEPADGVAEAAVHVQHGGRSRAVALRLEGLDGRWRCTALQLG